MIFLQLIQSDKYHFHFISNVFNNETIGDFSINNCPFPEQHLCELPLNTYVSIAKNETKIHLETAQVEL